jgi:hypothetical protein
MRLFWRIFIFCSYDSHSEESISPEIIAGKVQGKKDKGRQQTVARDIQNSNRGVDRYESSQCIEKVRRSFKWARHVIFYGLLAMMWGAVAFAYFCMPVGPNLKVFITFGAVVATCVWIAMALTAEPTMFIAFFYTVRTSICAN